MTVFCVGEMQHRIKQVQMENVWVKETKQISHALMEYMERASLVGTTILVLPDDPLVTAVSKIVHVDHNYRPVEFIVSSYLLPDFEAEILKGRKRDEVDKSKGGDGIFHFLPVISVHQLTF